MWCKSLVQVAYLHCHAWQFGLPDMEEFGNVGLMLRLPLSRRRDRRMRRFCGM